VALAIIGVIASVIGAFYYLRVVKVMYFDEPARSSIRFRAKCAWSRWRPGRSLWPLSCSPSRCCTSAAAAALSLF
jgi:NADH-quinone oxidoreductase subunit N